MLSISLGLATILNTVFLVVMFLVFNLQVIYDKMTGNSRGFAFVTMSSAAEAEAAAQQFNNYVSLS